MIDFLASLNILTDQEIQELVAHSTTRMLQKDQFFVRENSVCDEVAFTKNGILRSFYTNDQADEITYCIYFENSFVTAYSSFITGKAAPENIQAITSAELTIIPTHYIKQQSKESRNWLELQKYFAEQGYLELEKRVFAYQKMDAEQRYNNLLENYPEYLQKIPLQYLASYLGITPRHLSRIRKEFTF